MEEINKFVYSVSEISNLTGWSTDRVRGLIYRGLLKATSTTPNGSVPRYQVLGAELRRFFGVEPAKAKRTRKQEIDDGCRQFF